MIRPRAGDFCFDSVEVDIMLADIAAARNAGLAGVVLGAATATNLLDVATLARLCSQAQGIGKTLHRVIDLLADPLRAVDQAIELGFDRILTSGGALTAPQGRSTLAAMQAHSRGRIVIMAGSGVTAANAAGLMRETGIRSLHASCSRTDQSPAGLARMGFAPTTVRRTDAGQIAALKRVSDM